MQAITQPTISLRMICFISFMVLIWLSSELFCADANLQYESSIRMRMRAQRTPIPGHDQAAFTRKHTGTRDLRASRCISCEIWNLVVFGMEIRVLATQRLYARGTRFVWLW